LVAPKNLLILINYKLTNLIFLLNELLELLLKIKPEDTSNFDVENILIAINGSDSSAMEGKYTIVHDGDIVSIIPVIHGGSSKKLLF